ncbi:iron-sulfur cluster assembly scaffold protein, partial [Candidatus Magnetobacterium casensis]|nr:iron-sulfur cluster assembly scaffold protein [Candidatus Magnetobacterium casensis]
MGLTLLSTPFPWARYSKKLVAKIENPRCAGFFTKEEAEARDMRMVEGHDGRLVDGNAVKLYWLVDKDDGIIVDAKFQVYGQSALIGAAEAACELLVGKNYDQARRVSADLIDKQVRDRSEVPAFPKETHPHLNLILQAIDVAADQCTDIPFADTYVSAPVPKDMGEVIPGGYPGWMELPLKKKIAVVEQVLDQDVRPYIALDAGGVSVLNL